MPLSQSQFPGLCQSIAGRSRDDFYAAFPWDAADRFSPTVIAHWNGRRWTFIGQVRHYVEPDIVVDSDNLVWFVNGNALQAYDARGIRKANRRIGDRIQGLDVCEGDGGDFWVLHGPCRATRVRESGCRTIILSQAGDLIALATDSRGRLWAGGNREGLVFQKNGGTAQLVLWDGTKTRQIATPRSAGGITALLTTPDGSLVIATACGRIYRGDSDRIAEGSGKLGLWTETPDISHFISKMGGDGQNGLYAIGYNQLHHWRRHRWTRIQVKQRGKPMWVRSIRVVKDGVVVGSYKGVVVGPPWKQLPMIPKSWFDR